MWRYITFKSIQTPESLQSAYWSQLSDACTSSAYNIVIHTWKSKGFSKAWSPVLASRIMQVEQMKQHRLGPVLIVIEIYSCGNQMTKRRSMRDLQTWFFGWHLGMVEFVLARLSIQSESSKTLLSIGRHEKDTLALGCPCFLMITCMKLPQCFQFSLSCTIFHQFKGC